MPFKNTQERLDQIDSYLKKEINAGTYTNKKAKKDLKAAWNLINKRITKLKLRKKVNKIIAGMGYTANPGELLDSPQITKVKEWLTKNEVDLQGRKVVDNYALADELKKIYKLKDRNAGVRKATYLKNYVSKIFDDVEIVKGKVFKYLKGFEDKLKNDPIFKKVVDDALPILKKKSLFDLTNDQRNTLVARANMLADREKKLPENAITKAEFIKKTGFPETSITSWMSATKNEPVGKEFNKLYKPVVFANQATYFPDPDQKTMDKFKEFREQGTIQKSSAEQLDKLTSEKNLKKLDGYLSGKGGRQLPPLKVVQGILGKGTSAYNAAWIMSLYARALEGEKFRGLKNNIKKDVSKGKFIFKKIGEEGGRHNEYTVALYNQAVKQVDKDMGNRKEGRMTFKKFKDEYTDKMNELLKKHKIDRKFNINEVISIKSAFNNSMAPYAAFVDLTEQQINKGVLAAYQGDMSKAMTYLDKYRDDPEKFKRKIEMFNRGLWEKDKLGKDVWRPGTKEKRIAELTRKFGPEAAEQVRFAEIIPGTKLTDTYKQTDLDFWKSKGLDLEKFAQDKGYYLDVKGARPYFEITQNRLLKAVENLSKKEQLAYCSLLSAGGLPGDCKNAIKKNPVKAAQVLADAPTSSSAMGSVKAIATNLLKRLPKGGRLGALVAGAGAVGLGAGALMGEAQADELDPETDTMVYSPVEGKFVDKEDGDPEDQMGILNWIADNPVKSSVMAMPAMYGIGVGANKLGAAKTAAYLTNWKAMIPAMMVPEKLWQYREGESLGEMTTDPWNAIWALGIDSNASLAKKGQYYINLIKDPALKARLAKEFADAGGNLAKKAAIGKQAFEITGANVFGREFWGSKNKMARLGASITSPAAAGTDLAFNQRFKPAMKKMADVFGSQVSGKLAKRGIGALAKRVVLGLGATAGMVALGIPGAVVSTAAATLFGLDYLREQLGDYSMGKKKIDRLRSMGKISEEDANNYMSLLMQENLLPFGVGNRLFGKDEMMIGGQILDPDDQRAVAKGMEDEIDSIKESDRGTRAKWRQQEFFNEGGRVGMKFGGGMDRRGFLKWLAGITAGAVGGVKGLWKPGAKKVVAEVAKETLTTTNPDMWVPRLIAKIKAEGKLLEMADKKYVNGDIYEVLINGKKVRLESNPVSGQHQIDWQAPDYDGEMTRSIQFNEGEIITEGKLAGKKTNPEVNFYEPDRSTPYRDDFSDFDWVNDSDQILDDMQRWIGLEDVNVKPTGPQTSNIDMEGYKWSPDDEFSQGGEVETGAIARRQSEVPPLSGPDPQAQGIAGLFSQPKQVRVG